jgi:hypothetical protein
METRPRGSHHLRELRLDRHVDVFVVHIPLEGAVLDFACNLLEAGIDCLLVLIRDDALAGKHLRMGTRCPDILLRHRLVHLERCTEFLREGIDALLEPATPESHG